MTSCWSFKVKKLFCILSKCHIKVSREVALEFSCDYSVKCVLNAVDRLAARLLLHTCKFIRCLSTQILFHLTRLLYLCAAHKSRLSYWFYEFKMELYWFMTYVSSFNKVVEKYNEVALCCMNGGELSASEMWNVRVYLYVDAQNL